jgi:hypothetical protein
LIPFFRFDERHPQSPWFSPVARNLLRPSGSALPPPRPRLRWRRPAGRPCFVWAPPRRFWPAVAPVPLSPLCKHEGRERDRRPNGGEPGPPETREGRDGTRERRRPRAGWRFFPRKTAFLARLFRRLPPSCSPCCLIQRRQAGAVGCRSHGAVRRPAAGRPGWQWGLRLEKEGLPRYRLSRRVSSGPSGGRELGCRPGKRAEGPPVHDGPSGAIGDHSPQTDIRLFRTTPRHRSGAPCRDSGRLGLMGSRVTLRPVEEADLVVFRRLFVDPTATGEFEWFGYRRRPLPRTHTGAACSTRTGSIFQSLRCHSRVFHQRRSVWVPAVVAAGHPHAGFHDLRRASATAL